MGNIDPNAILKALRTIGRNDKLRAQFLSVIRDVERSLEYTDASIRDEITGPIIDALHGGEQVYRRRLRSGIVLDFYYRSKIARDFVMCDPERPDHVWEPQTTKLLMYLSTRAKNVIVGGAYFGDQAILVAKRIARNGGICHAFEPDYVQSQMLVHNAALNGLDNIKVIRMGLWSDNISTLTLVGEDAEAHSAPVTEPTATTQSSTFGATTVDSYLSRNGIEAVDLIMLDIEGGEYEALQGANGQLSLPVGRAPDVVFEIHRNYVDWTAGLQNTDIVKYLSALGYKLYAIRDFHSNYDMRGKPIELIPPESTYLEGPPHGFNMLAVKNPSVVDSKHFRICRDVSPKLLLHKDPRLHHPVDGLTHRSRRRGIEHR